MIKEFNFAKKNIHIRLREENQKTINVLPLLKDPFEFAGDYNVDHIIRFGDVFEGLIGEYHNQFGAWQKNKLPKQNIIILEYYYSEAKIIMNKINILAHKLIANPDKYDDKELCKEYYLLASAGYKLLREKQKRFFPDFYTDSYVSLERAGLVSTRLALGLNKDAKILNEVRVVTKRTHLKDESETNLSVTIKWRNKNKLKKLILNKNIELNDFVNPASGASGSAFIIATIINKIKPSMVLHRSVALTRQGSLFIGKTFKSLGIKTIFYSLGECDSLNNMYYLIGSRSVGDAGRALRHFLPKWYKK